MPCREVIAQKSIIDMSHPVINIPERELCYKFMIEEALWILSGSNKVFHTHMRPFSDNDRVLQGAYGPKITEQMQYVLEKLNEDPDTRQAVISTWREAPRNSKDIPCTLSLQFLLRPREGVDYLDLVVSMRSSDLWLGFPYDIFSFTMIAHYVRLLGKDTARIHGDVRCGMLLVTAGSSHLYEKNVLGAEKCIRTKSTGSLFNMDLYDLDTPEELVEYLDGLSKDIGTRRLALGYA